MLLNIGGAVLRLKAFLNLSFSDVLISDVVKKFCTLVFV